MPQCKSVCHSWSDLSTNNSKIGPWSRDLLDVQFKHHLSIFLGLSATIPSFGVHDVVQGVWMAWWCLHIITTYTLTNQARCRISTHITTSISYDVYKCYHPIWRCYNLLAPRPNSNFGGVVLHKIKGVGKTFVLGRYRASPDPCLSYPHTQNSPAHSVGW